MQYGKLKKYRFANFFKYNKWKNAKLNRRQDF